MAFSLTLTNSGDASKMPAGIRVRWRDDRLSRRGGSALVFQARIGDIAVEGCDLLHLDESGQIDEFTVMVRPLSAAQALAAAMGAQFEQIQREATAV